jgi:hypothetical protein
MVAGVACPIVLALLDVSMAEFQVLFFVVIPLHQYYA